MEDQWLETLQKGKCITERDLKILCEKVYTLIAFILFMFFSFFNRFNLFGLILFIIGERNPNRRIKRATCKCTGYYLRRYPWTIL